MNKLSDPLRLNIAEIAKQLEQGGLERQRLDENIAALTELQISSLKTLILALKTENASPAEIENYEVLLRDLEKQSISPSGTEKFLIDKEMLVLEILRNAGEHGARPAAIIQEFAKRGVKIHRNSIYSLIMNMKRRNKILEKNRRYFHI